ncbi:MAG: hypothetical protein ACP5UB_00575 [Candidatus Sumerlaeaceae bacterium]
MLGQFKRGKSSLVNAPDGRAILPRPRVPLTVVTTFLCQGTPERLFLQCLNGHTEQHGILEIAHHMAKVEKTRIVSASGHVEMFLQFDILPPVGCLIATPAPVLFFCTTPPPL